MINDRVVFSSTVEFKSCETPEMSRRVELCYDTRNPYAIKATFVDTGWNMWLGRAFLKEGLVTDVSSYGLVKMQPSDDDPAMVSIKMVVSSTGDYSVFETKAQAIANILGRTYDVVPSGEEPRWAAWQSNLYDQSGFDGDLYLFAESGAGKIDKAEYDRRTDVRIYAKKILQGMISSHLGIPCVEILDLADTAIENRMVRCIRGMKVARNTGNKAKHDRLRGELDDLIIRQSELTLDDLGAATIQIYLDESTLKVFLDRREKIAMKEIRKETRRMQEKYYRELVEKTVKGPIARFFHRYIERHDSRSNRDTES